MFLKNCWYVAAWESEVGREPFARTVCGEPLVMFRDEAGQAYALEDRCCHRNLPLSMGKVEGSDLRCGYHGLKFDAQGNCIEVPGQVQIPPGAKVRGYKLLEKWHLLWIWMGDPDKADEKLLPRWQHLVDPKLAVARGNDAKPLSMKCDWQLNNDNLLDLSHIVYVHPTTLGAHGLDRTPITTERFERSVRMRRFVPNVAPIKLWASYMNYPDIKVDRWMSTDCELPSHCTVDVGFAPAGELTPDGDLDKGIRLYALITATPETADTSFMFYAQCRNFATDNDEITQKFVRDVKVVFGEDVSTMEAQQRAGVTRADVKKIDINADAPSIAMRDIVRRYVALETNR
jgi:phenylpropionate dioxygenase-like ring-hydroxylating dioxygenase large terminal subunit